jgi:hypothetical protein
MSVITTLAYCCDVAVHMQFLTAQFAPSVWAVPATPVIYTRVGGNILFGPQDMPFQQDVWANIGQGVPSIDPAESTSADAFDAWASAMTYKIAMGLQSDRGRLYSAGAHICSYRCMLSSYVANATGDWCLMHSADAATLGKASYCGNFPPYAIAAIFPTTPAFP